MVTLSVKIGYILSLPNSLPPPPRRNFMLKGMLGGLSLHDVIKKTSFKASVIIKHKFCYSERISIREMK